MVLRVSHAAQRPANVQPAAEPAEEPMLGLRQHADVKDLSFFAKTTLQFLTDSGWGSTIQEDGYLRVYHGTSRKNATGIERSGAFRGFPFFTPDQKIAMSYARQVGGTPVVMELRLDPDAILPCGGYLSARMEGLHRREDGSWGLAPLEKRPGPVDVHSPEFREWFGASRVVGAEGEPVVVYHGTDQDLSNFNPDQGKGKTFGTGTFFTSSPHVASSYAGGANRGAVLPVYLKLVHPAEVDALGRNWNRIGRDAKVTLPSVVVPDPDEVLLAELESREPNPEATIRRKAKASTIGRLFKGEMDYDDDFMSTDDLARWARESGYDGLIVRNLRDRGPAGAYATPEAEHPGTLYVAFAPVQAKSALSNTGAFSSVDSDLRG